MRVVRLAFMIDGLNVGGTETNLLRLVQRLDPARFPLTILYSKDGPLTPRYVETGLRLERIRITSLKSPSAFTAAVGLRAFLRRERIDVLHTQDVYSNVLAAFALTGFRSTRFIASRRWGLHQYGRLLSSANRLAYRRADAVLANSDGVGESLIREEGVRAARVVVMPNFAEAALFEPVVPAVRVRLREELGVPADAAVVGCIANLWTGKDQATLLRAVASIALPNRSLHLVLIGEGPERQALEGLAASLGMADRTHFAGAILGAARYHHAFDVSTLTSHSEGFPNSVVEAMAAGRPVVATRVGGVPDAVADGVTGFLLSVGDVAALAEKLQRLLTDEALARSMGEHGRVVAQEKFHETEVMRRLAALYDRLGDDSWRPGLGGLQQSAAGTG